MSTLFDLSFSVTVPFWALMIFAPTWRWTRTIIGSPWIVLAPLVIWAIVAVPVLGTLWALVLSPSLSAITDAAADPAILTALWAQILAWDLFLGRWVYLDSRRRGLHPVLMGPLLVGVILLSPLVFPVYLVVREAVGRREREVVGAA
ncbi:ABA4-like family protein [Nocardia sp. AG03]|uniref:ABA4-like family protein n=1 Tax=Nocardia sp. AG03 TaxID=3025312 RepID=UPI002418329C|nr:ABA4-like family protein [Nocardia sp. AG03]